MQPLTNARWGFESSCFVCEPTNPHGLQLPFFHDTASAEVVAEFELDERFSGAPSYIHGGVVLAIVDEAMAWAAIALAEQWAVTKETTTRFERPVRVGRGHTVRARVVQRLDAEIKIEAEVFDDKGRRCATAAATFTPLGAAQAADAVGGDVAEEDRRYLSRDR